MSVDLHTAGRPRLHGTRAHRSANCPEQLRRGGIGVTLYRLDGAWLAATKADHSHHVEDIAGHWRRGPQARLLAIASSDFHGSRKAARIGEWTTRDHMVQHCTYE